MICKCPFISNVGNITLVLNNTERDSKTLTIPIGVQILNIFDGILVNKSSKAIRFTVDSPSNLPIIQPLNIVVLGGCTIQIGTTDFYVADYRSNDFIFTLESEDKSPTNGIVDIRYHYLDPKSKSG